MEKKIFWIPVLLCCLMIINMPMQAAASEKVDQRTVRVGFFEADGYHIVDEDGTMSGYGFDFLQMLLRYNDWKYEYVSYDKNWSDMPGMLEKGEIDMVTLANMTPERLEQFDFSSKSIGTSSTIMTASADNTAIIAGDYDSYNGARIGLVEGSSHNKKFKEYAAEHGFSYEPVYYYNLADLLAELRAGENIDIAVTSNMRQVRNEIILEEFNAAEYYAIVKKGNESLLAELNHGIEQLDIYTPDWKSTLFQKYYANINENAISLSVEEREYIAELKSGGTVLKVAMNPELKPYSYFEEENGTVRARGIAPAIFAEAAKRLDIEYEILQSKDRWEYKEQMDSGEADIDLTAFLDYSIAQKYGLKETDAYLTSSLAMVTRRNTEFERGNMVVAALRDPTEYIGFNNELIYQNRYIEYDSIEECVNAVKNGDADATIHYVYVAEQAVQNDYQNRLQYSILQDATFELAIGVRSGGDHRLLSILNKGVNSISNSFTERVMLEERTDIEYSDSLLALAYDEPVAAVLIGMIFLLFIFTVVLLILRTKNQKKERLAAMELERFVGYVCESNDMIEEIDLKAKQRRIYELVDNRISMRVEAHETFDKTFFETRIHPEDLEKIVEAFSDTTIDGMIEEGGKEHYIECRVKETDNGDGNPPQYNWYSYVIKAVPKDTRHPRNFIVFKKKIQELKLEEEKQRQVLKDALVTAQKASSAKGIFVSRISHEIRTPLNAIIGYLDMAEEMKENQDKLMHCIHNGKSASAHLLGLINDVLDMSAIENNKMKLSSGEFDLKELVTSITSIYYNQAEQKGIRFEVEIRDLTEELVNGDLLRVKQILMNLLSNAFKFTGAGQSVTFRIEQVKTTEQQIHIRFIVKDTGIGMEQGFKEHIFEPFEQENVSIAQKYGGSGLGLSITKNLIDMMEGSIQVSSEKDVGTTFTVLLAFGKSSHENKAQDAVLFPKVRALVVDAETEDAKYIKGLLKHFGVKCDIVDSAQKAKKKIIGRKETDYAYNLCIIDWTTRKDRTDFTEMQIVAQCGEDRPIMVATAYDVAETMEQAKEAGIDQVIAKPLFQSSIYDLLVMQFGEYQPKNEEDIGDTALEGISVLLAEDNEMNMEIAVHLLEKAGMEITPAENGKEAVEKFLNSEPETYQVILMDIQMPIMNGYEAAQAIRSSSHPEAKTIPIIALTANAFAEDVSNALNAGMNEHISKPIDKVKLYRVLKKLS